MVAGGQLGVAVADAVEQSSQAADGVVGFGGQEGEAVAEFERSQMFGAGDLVAFEQANQIVVEAELADEAELGGSGERVDADSAGAAMQRQRS